MKKFLISMLIYLSIIPTLHSFAYASLAPADALSHPAIPEVIEVQSKYAKDPRVVALTTFLEGYKSPLTPYAAVFVEKADKYNLPDWKLLPAIAGVESTFGKRIPPGSYNAYGWANGGYAFKNWEESIVIISKALSEKYYGRGANTVAKIARIYCPPSTTWAGNVQFFMNKLQSVYESHLLAENPDLAFSL